MNAINDNNDPFEDIFRNRFADFESEPDTQLWQKIEPKLPVDSIRKFPYWQISAVAILLLLAGLWTYREEYSSEIITKSGDNSQKIVLNNPLIINDLEKNTTQKLEDKIDISKWSVENTETHSQTRTKLTETVIPTNRITEARRTVRNVKNTIEGTNTSSSRFGDPMRRDDKYPEIVEKEKSSLFLNPNTTIELSNTSFNKTEKNNKLNLYSIINSNEKQEIIKDNTSNSQSVFSVFSNKENVSVLNKNFLTSLGSKSYSLLSNHFKTPKLKFVVAPKKDDYFKERKPLEIYASVMPLLNYYTITPNGNDANYVHSISVNNDDNRLGFYTQAGSVFTLSDRFKLRTGLTFTRTNHSINYQIRTDSLIVQSFDKQGVDVSFEEKKVNYLQVANYLGTKIEVQYTILEGEALRHYVSAGLEGAYRLNGFKQFNGFANFAYGVTRQIGDNAYLFIEPTFSYSLNQQSDNNSFLLVKPNKIGFNIGVNFKIK